VVLLEASKLRNPNHPKFRFMLAILNGQLAANLELAANETQPDTGFGDIQSMRQIAVGAGNVVTGDSHRQDSFGSVVTASIIHFPTPCWTLARE
jgi:hypothetical protein